MQFWPALLCALAGDPIDQPAGWHIEVLGAGTGAIANWQFTVHNGLLPFERPEAWDGLDLNGDGDADDSVLRIYDSVDHSIDGPSVFGTPLFPQDEENRRHIGIFIDDAFHLYDRQTGTLTDWGIAPQPYFAFNQNGAAWRRSESEDAAGGSGSLLDYDYNGDGDTDDHVVFVYDRVLDETLPLYAVQLALVDGPRFVLRGRRLLLVSSENKQGVTDLNGDGDLGDPVRVLYEFGTGIAKVLPFACGLSNGEARYLMPTEGEHPYLMLVSEKNQGNTDLNGDGDITDLVLHEYDPLTDVVVNLGIAATETAQVDGRIAFLAFEVGFLDLNGDGDDSDRVLHLYDPRRGELRNLGLAVNSLDSLRLSGSFGAVFVDEFKQGGSDLDGDGGLGEALISFDLQRGVTVPLPGAVKEPERVVLVDSLLTYLVDEAVLSADLNADGQLSGEHIFTYDIRTGSLHDLLAHGMFPSPEFAAAQGAVLVSYLESDVLIDIDGDGDLGDRVFVLHDFESSSHAFGSEGRLLMSLEDGFLSNLPIVGVTGTLAIFAPEFIIGQDLNGNGMLSTSGIFVLTRR